MKLFAAPTFSVAALPSPYLWDMNHLYPLFQPPQQTDKPSFAEDSNRGDEQIRIEKQKQTQHNQTEGLSEEENIARSKCEWDFSLATVVSSSGAPANSASDTLGVIEFDPTGTVMATAGMARKIRVYKWDSLIQSSTADTAERLDHARVCDYYICTPAKISSLRWKPGSGRGVIGSGDYDGVVTEYDLERRVPTFERDEHGGRRVWSVDYTQWTPAVGASCSDDGTVQVWDTRCDIGSCVAALRHRSPVCSVEFNPFGGALMAIGCADRKAYGYDVRSLVDPVQVFEGHSKTVTYVRFLDVQTVVSASTDGCLKQWNVDDGRVVRTYRGHVNSRSFVGLSVLSRDGLLGCGSESDQVFIYDKRWEEPVWVHGGGSGEGGRGGRFVSSVGWRQVREDQCTLVAGGSDGVLQVFEGKKTNTTA